MNQVFKNVITSEEELRALAGYPSEGVKKKVIPALDSHCRDFMAKSPFLTLATADSNGACDVSPRGDAPGFVHIIDDHHFVIPERPGNRRMDSITNILANPQVGILFFIPRLGETLRVNGKAVLITDDDLLEKMQVQGKKPVLGIGIQVEECFIHCAKAFIRSGLWNPDSWSEKELLPSVARILKDHIHLPDVEVEVIEEDLKASYEKHLY
ncbi:pyridoxamine 5'-phosphate oxidase family protein [Halalkalibacter kiskunsagensis]|uniref:Pyridoxamine 5'-phosphate oxidase family protein n=1 Tax=Halalkalibacter kiskunsagensis TaxID=1548599 RepID=A0ABV6KAP9_9BACI